jgi:hypothetical protein
MPEPCPRTSLPAGTPVGVNVLRQLALLIGYIAAGVARAVRRHAFYARLAAAQTGSPSDSRLARADARRMNVGWVLVWRASPEVLYYLRQTGFRFNYRAGGVSGVPAGRHPARSALARSPSAPAASPGPHRHLPSLARQHHPAHTSGAALYVNDWFRTCDAG